ncbi:MAG: B12-binding domain-containing protein [Bacteroidota bacterium]
MSEIEIAEKVAAISEVNFEHGTQLDALTISMIEMDEFKFDRIVSTNIQQLGFERTILEIIYPFLDKLGVLWLTGSVNPVQENFMSYLIRQKIISAIDREPIVTGKDPKKIFIYLPEGESQELILLLMHYLLKARGFRVIYLGLNINISDIQDCYNIHQPDYIFTMITETYARKPVQHYVDQLASVFPDCHILLSGYQVVSQQVAPPSNVEILPSLDATMDLLDRLKMDSTRTTSSNGTSNGTDIR